MGKIIITGKIFDTICKKGYELYIYQIKGCPKIVSSKLIPINNRNKNYLIINGSISKEISYIKVKCRYCNNSRYIFTEAPIIKVKEFYFTNIPSTNKITLQGNILKINDKWPNASYIVVSNLNKYYVESFDKQSIKDNIFLSVSKNIKVEGTYYYKQKKKKNACINCGKVFTYTEGVNLVHSIKSEIIL